MQLLLHLSGSPAPVEAKSRRENRLTSDVESLSDCWLFSCRLSWLRVRLSAASTCDKNYDSSRGFHSAFDVGGTLKNVITRSCCGESVHYSIRVCSSRQSSEVEPYPNRCGIKQFHNFTTQALSWSSFLSQEMSKAREISRGFISQTVITFVINIFNLFSVWVCRHQNFLFTNWQMKGKKPL